MMKKLNALFESMVEVPRIRIGGRQTIETLIDEEASLLAKFLRDELNTWEPRISIQDACAYKFMYAQEIKNEILKL